MKAFLPKHLIIIPLIGLLASCQENGRHEQFVFMKDIQEWILPEYSLKSRHIRNGIEQLIQTEPRMYADKYTRKYYAGRGHFIWINRHGVGENADTLLSCLSNVAEEGFNPSSFGIAGIEEDLRNLRNRNGSKQDINQLMARLEYRLTKAYLRYAAGQRYGYTLPEMDVQSK